MLLHMHNKNNIYHNNNKSKETWMGKSYLPSSIYPSSPQLTYKLALIYFLQCVPLIIF